MSIVSRRDFIGGAIPFGLMTSLAFTYVDDDGGGRADPSRNGEAPRSGGNFTDRQGRRHRLDRFTPRGGRDGVGRSGRDDWGDNGSPVGRDPTNSD